MKVLFNNLKRGFELYRGEYESKVLEVMNSGWYILGKEVSAFEKEFSQKNKVQFAIGVGSGLAAIYLGIKALGIGAGDEVILQANTYIATIIGVIHNGAIPILVEPDEYYNIDADKIESKITCKTKAILVTHLYGQAAEMDKLKRICDNHNLFLLEDCAQAHFAEFNQKKVGTFGKMGFFSFYPTKNLGAFGDSGAIITDDEALADKLKALRNYGSKVKYDNKFIGYNSRLDEIQAGLLRIKLLHIDEMQAERTLIAEQYLKKIKNSLLTLPQTRTNATHVWHLFVIRCEKRESLQQHLSSKGIGFDMHYPIPPHLSTAFKCLDYQEGMLPITEMYANQVLSIPIYNGMLREEIEAVIQALNTFQ